MSIKWMVWVWENSPFKQAQLLIHLKLADFANDNGVCWPSVETIAKAARCTPRHVQDTLSTMEEMKLLKKTYRRGRATLYGLYGMDEENDPPDMGVAGGEPQFTPGVKPSSGAPEPQFTQNLKEPPIEHPTYSEPAAQIVPDEPEYVTNIDDQWATESTGKKRPKWQTPNAEMMRYMAPFGRKWFHSTDERSQCKQLLSLLDANMITEEWVEEVLRQATEPTEKGHPRWTFEGFLRKATSTEQYRDWQIKYDNAKRSREDATPDPTSLEQIEAYYSED
jgi:hypothetical protein